MKERYWLFRRKGVFYVQDTESGKQVSLRTRDKRQAQTLFHARNEAYRQPNLNLQLARTYLSASDPAINRRTWQTVMHEMVSMKSGSTKARWETAIKDSAFDAIRNLPVLETKSEHLWAVLKSGTVSTNAFLRRLHNFAVGMAWLPWPIIPKLQWPAITFKEKRAITLDEHLRIVERERNPERKAFYELAWYLGASQSDLAHLHAEDIDWTDRTITFERAKLRSRGGATAQIRFGDEAAALLMQLPRTGPIFPYLITVREADRATEFRQRCKGLGIEGVTLHSYRYAWAERAKVCGYPERFAQMALGHNSKAVHRAYARKAQVTVPALEDFEKSFQQSKIIPFATATA